MYVYIYMYIYVCVCIYIYVYIYMIYIYIYTDTFQIFHGHGSCRVAGNENPATVELAPQSQTPLEQGRHWSHALWWIMGN